MRRTVLYLLMLLLVPIIASAQGLTRTFVASLTGAAERPGPGDPNGSGVAVVTINDDMSITYTIYIKNISSTITGGHIHETPPGAEAGGVVVNFNPSFVDGVATGTVRNVDSALIGRILANPGPFYVNVHTNEFLAGAIRGSIVPGCTPSATVMCLNENRFRVEANWMIPDGSVGPGRAEKLTDDSGSFWFFNEDNIELLVKVLNACGGFNSQWVFAAGLTNVDVELFVVDTQTGASKRYRNPQGTAFQPIQDTAAFACP